MSERPKMDLDKITSEQWKQMGTTREQLEESSKKRQKREDNAPVVGDKAPDFELKRLSDNGKITEDRVRLSDLRGKPVALVFGSYT